MLPFCSSPSSFSAFEPASGAPIRCRLPFDTLSIAFNHLTHLHHRGHTRLPLTKPPMPIHPTDLTPHAHLSDLTHPNSDIPRFPALSLCTTSTASTSHPRLSPTRTRSQQKHREPVPQAASDAREPTAHHAHRAVTASTDAEAATRARRRVPAVTSDPDSPVSAAVPVLLRPRKPCAANDVASAYSRRVSSLRSGTRGDAYRC